MRKFLLIMIVFLILGGTLGLLMRQDSGYILISFAGATIETSFWVFILFIVLLLIALDWTKRILFATLRPGSSLAKLTGNISQKRASRNTIRGLLELVGGNWLRAEKLLTKSADKVPYPLINYIGAAYAASEQEEHERSKTLLQTAHKSTPEADFAISFAQSQIQMRQKHYESALATLLRLHKIKPKHRQVLKMLVQAYTRLKDWDAILLLTPKLKKEGILDTANMLELEKKAFLALLENMQHRKKLGHKEEDLIKEMESIWHKFSEIDKDENMRVLYARSLISFDNTKKAEEFIRQSLNHKWSESLISEYGHITSVNSKSALQTAEAWLKKYPQSAGLLLVCGRLSQQQKLWGKAKDYYQSSIDIDPTGEALGELGRLLTALGDVEHSHQLMLTSLQHSAKNLKALPLP
ncbi:heme biosynthesis protein HemY [Marinomonas sp. 15G1-11]|uniref:Heme biosynthesis protein HemY n=1 Tax=Marinomonas phaeophyticola TaxID=3004091 RepID=A0ABT4JTX5_9GAMM|nr:heme biosynthesis HemY N-terminal domain-containing protein [Marinomonas sp. 15G1-11]MCZ2721789.1 heme biosynthesis protein HemY [Marinomonas sp. 15G1-11]